MTSSILAVAQRVSGKRERGEVEKRVIRELIRNDTPELVP
jgi:hypothetical protein